MNVGHPLPLPFVDELGVLPPKGFVQRQAASIEPGPSEKTRQLKHQKNGAWPWKIVIFAMENDDVTIETWDLTLKMMVLPRKTLFHHKKMDISWTEMRIASPKLEFDQDSCHKIGM